MNVLPSELGGLSLDATEELLTALDIAPALKRKAMLLCKLRPDLGLSVDDLINDALLELTGPSTLERLQKHLGAKLVSAGAACLPYASEAQNLTQSLTDAATLSSNLVNELLEKVDVLARLRLSLTTPQALRRLKRELAETFALVAQRCLLRVWRALKRKSARRQRLFETYAGDVARCNEGISESQPLDGLITDELWEQLGSLLKTDEQRQLLDLRYRKCKSFKEIGEELDIPTKTAKERTYRMLKVLKEKPRECAGVFEVDVPNN